MYANLVRCVVLVVLAAAVGCGKAPEQAKAPDGPPVQPAVNVTPPKITPPEKPGDPVVDRVAPPPRPGKERPFVGFRRAALTKDEQADAVSHIPGAIRSLSGTDADLFKDLGGLAFAWEFTGGPVRLWVECEEEGQPASAKKYPSRENDWTVKGEKGRVVFWMRRGVSEKVNAALSKAGRPTGDTSAVALGVVAAPGGFDATVALANPLWYGWKQASVGDRPPAEAVPVWDGEPVAIHSVEATEVAEGGTKPRRATLTIYVQRLKTE